MSQEKIFADWTEREAIAESMVPMIGRLYRDSEVETSVFGKLIVKRSVIDILKTHEYGRQIEETNDLSVHDTYPVLQAMEKMNLNRAHVDIGKLAVKFRGEASDRSLEAFLDDELAGAAANGEDTTPTDVVLYGFGRIGRLLARLLIEKTGGGQRLRLRAIVVRSKGAGDLVKRASLLRRDSVHGPFMGNIRVDEENSAIIANGNMIKVIYASAPDSIDYTEYGISNAIVVDNTGKWRDCDGLSLHLRANGVSRVLLTAPGKGVKNIVMGVNTADITDEDEILSAASCTTNAITPVLKKLNDRFGVKNGHVETVHSYTNDQNLIDNFHGGDRRGRAAGLNMVLTETGAAKAVAKALPEMEGKLTGSSIRVPTPNVSMAILNLNLEQGTSKEELNAYLLGAAQQSELQKQIDYSDDSDAVSTDFVGSRSAGVVDGLATIVSKDSCVVYIWYDNEFGYSCQVLRLLQHMGRSALQAYPVRE